VSQNYLFIGISFYRNIFLLQYRVQKYLVCIGPESEAELLKYIKSRLMARFKVITLELKPVIFINQTFM